MAIKVRCRNQNCPMFNQECMIDPLLNMAPGELILCGGCGHEPRWIGNERPTRTLPWNENMNKAVPHIPMNDADL